MNGHFRERESVPLLNFSKNIVQRIFLKNCAILSQGIKIKKQ